jgi:potassium efflux system protein
MLLGLVCGAMDSARAQEVPALTAEAPIVNDLTVEAISARLAKIQENKDLDPALKARLSEIYAKVVVALESAAEANARAERFNKRTVDVPTTLEESKRELAIPVSDLPIDLTRDAPLTQAIQCLSTSEAELIEAQKVLKDLQDEPKRRADRRVEIPRIAEAAKAQLQDLGQKLEARPAADEPVELAAATRLQLEAMKAMLLAESTANASELRFYESAGELLPVRRDLAARRVAQLESLVKRLQDDVNERRSRDAEQQASEARRVAARAHPALRAIAERNTELANLRQVMASKIEAEVKNLDRLGSRVARIADQFTKISKRVEVGQRNQSIGLLLRKQREELPDVSLERARMQSRAEQITATSLDLIEYEDERDGLATLDGPLTAALEGLGADVMPKERALLEEDVRGMLQTQRDYLDAIIVDTNGYLDKLAEQTARQQELIAKAQKYLAYCDERILWIRSANSIFVPPPVEFWPAILKLFHWPLWQSLGQLASSEIATHMWAAGLTMVLLLGSLVLLKRMRRALVLCGDRAVRGSCRTILPTVKSFVLTTLLAMPWPVMLALVGLQLAAAQTHTEIAHSLGHGLVVISLELFGLEWLRQFSRHGGLCESHLGWDPTSVTQMRRGLFGIMAIGLPIMLVITITEFQSNESIKNYLGRPAFIVLNLLALIPTYRLLHPTKGIITVVYQNDPQAWWSRLGWVWFGAWMACALSLVGLAMSGFYFTAVQIWSRLLVTSWLVVGLIVVYGLLLRWSLVAYRNLSMQRLQERRAAAAADASIPAQPINTHLEIKLSDINQQTRQTLQLIVATGLAIGVWGIWVTVVPALGALRHVILWNVASGVGVDARELPITLADLVLSVLVITLTFAFSRRIPSLLELTVLNRLPLDAGARYATGTVAKYVITATGIAVSCASLGFEWSQVQWLVAAVSVGLGFGLQEIFANFVSGLILLFERPIRVGDIVTLGDVEGKVSSIRMRSTTITDWDMRELVVPNKELITGRVINWTLSTTVSRMSIHVGVAYGTDPDQVRSALLEVAHRNPTVVKTPPPHALLDNFSDSTLNFVLRVYMPTRDVYLQLRHEIMTSIAARFDEAGIVFAFPQCDVHVQYPEAAEGAAPAKAESARTVREGRRVSPKSIRLGTPATTRRRMSG